MTSSMSLVDCESVTFESAGVSVGDQVASVDCAELASHVHCDPQWNSLGDNEKRTDDGSERSHLELGELNDSLGAEDDVCLHGHLDRQLSDLTSIPYIDSGSDSSGSDSDLPAVRGGELDQYLAGANTDEDSEVTEELAVDSGSDVMPFIGVKRASGPSGCENAKSLQSVSTAADGTPILLRSALKKGASRRRLQVVINELNNTYHQLEPDIYGSGGDTEESSGAESDELLESDVDGSEFGAELQTSVGVTVEETEALSPPEPYKDRVLTRSLDSHGTVTEVNAGKSSNTDGACVGAVRLVSSTTPTAAAVSSAPAAAAAAAAVEVGTSCSCRCTVPNSNANDDQQQKQLQQQQQLEQHKVQQQQQEKEQRTAAAGVSGGAAGEYDGCRNLPDVVCVEGGVCDCHLVNNNNLHSHHHSQLLHHKPQCVLAAAAAAAQTQTQTSSPSSSSLVSSPGILKGGRLWNESPASPARRSVRFSSNVQHSSNNNISSSSTSNVSSSNSGGDGDRVINTNYISNSCSSLSTLPVNNGKDDNTKLKDNNNSNTTATNTNNNSSSTFDTGSAGVSISAVMTENDPDNLVTDADSGAEEFWCVQRLNSCDDTSDAPAANEPALPKLQSYIDGSGELSNAEQPVVSYEGASPDTARELTTQNASYRMCSYNRTQSHLLQHEMFANVNDPSLQQHNGSPELHAKATNPVNNTVSRQWRQSETEPRHPATHSHTAESPLLPPLAGSSPWQRLLSPSIAASGSLPHSPTRQLSVPSDEQGRAALMTSATAVLDNNITDVLEDDDESALLLLPPPPPPPALSLSSSLLSSSSPTAGARLADARRQFVSALAGSSSTTNTPAPGIAGLGAGGLAVAGSGMADSGSSGVSSGVPSLRQRLWRRPSPSSPSATISSANTTAITAAPVVAAVAEDHLVASGSAYDSGSVASSSGGAASSDSYSLDDIDDVLRSHTSYELTKSSRSSAPGLVKTTPAQRCVSPPSTVASSFGSSSGDSYSGGHQMAPGAAAAGRDVDELAAFAAVQQVRTERLRQRYTLPTGPASAAPAIAAAASVSPTAGRSTTHSVGTFSSSASSAGANDMAGERTHISLRPNHTAATATDSRGIDGGGGGGGEDDDGGFLRRPSVRSLRPAQFGSTRQIFDQLQRQQLAAKRFRSLVASGCTVSRQQQQQLQQQQQQQMAAYSTINHPCYHIHPASSSSLKKCSSVPRQITSLYSSVPSLHTDAHTAPAERRDLVQCRSPLNNSTRECHGVSSGDGYVMAEYTPPLKAPPPLPPRDMHQNNAVTSPGVFLQQPTTAQLYQSTPNLFPNCGQQYCTGSLDRLQALPTPHPRSLAPPLRPLAPPQRSPVPPLNRAVPRSSAHLQSPVTHRGISGGPPHALNHSSVDLYAARGRNMNCSYMHDV